MKVPNCNSRGSKSKNITLSAAYGYSIKDIDLFVTSFLKKCQDSDLILIVDERSEQELGPLLNCSSRITFWRVSKSLKMSRFIKHFSLLLSRFQLQSIPLSLQDLGRKLLNPVFDRFFVYRRILDELGGVYANVLLTDCRDVIFQHNPFDFIQHKIHTGKEEKLIGSCPINSEWISTLYGESALEKMKNDSVICAGVSMGGIENMNKYLDLMCGEIWRHLSKIAFKFGYDQGMHNYIAHNRPELFRFEDNASGLIATLGYERRENIGFSSSGECLVIRGKPSAIVHQYDRHEIVCRNLNELRLVPDSSRM